MSILIENKKYSKVYKLIENYGTYQLCKVLNEYSSKEEANENLIKLLTDKRTEKDVLKEYSNKEVF